MQLTRLKSVYSLPLRQNIARSLCVPIDQKSDVKLKSWREVPGPPSLPIIGQLHHFFRGGELQNFEGPDALQKLYKKYGPIVRLEGIFGMPSMILLCDPEATAYILRSENWTPTRPGFVSLEYYRRHYKKSNRNVGTTGLITDHGDLWKDFRRTVNPVLLQPTTIKLYSNVIDDVAQEMMARIKDIRDEDKMLRNNFDHEMHLWALESLSTVAFGLRLNCLNSNLPSDSPQKQLVQCIHGLFEVSTQLDFKPNIWRYFSTPLFRRAMNLYEKHEKLIKHFVKKGIEELKHKKSLDTEQKKGVLENLLDINEEYAHIMGSDMLFAGVDTTANAVTGILYVLAKNQDKQDKLREEIRSKPDSKPYLKACIKEGLRVMPVVSGNMRRASREYNIMGYQIPKGMNIGFSNREMSLLESQFPRPQEFIPERWTTDKDDPLYYRNAHPFSYAPFGFGTRSCIGRRIADLEIETFLSRVIENFKVHWVGPPPKLFQTSILYIQGPFYFVFEDVK